MNWTKQSTKRGQQMRALILTGFSALVAGCAAPAPHAAFLPMAINFMAPGSTNTVIVPVDCRYGVWATDKGLLYLQGLSPE